MEAIVLYLWREARRDSGDTAFRRMEDNKTLGSLRKPPPQIPWHGRCSFYIWSGSCPGSPWFSWRRRMILEQKERLLPECGSVQECHPNYVFQQCGAES
ncbi:hypothetical protein K443DRAFT_539926 [Laccaria amethystina LaAM-08-1]|uniref:Uncharacterized protein n=1 Tax=Laccaria amethystina LaAM-08-1 TaxID=1095629 RepID=A0A0C9XKR5_9AGAR|nr:hypothetical protein K443DRAFT_539926 [Laccaria amethystina LaAM-08-1]